MTLPMLRPRTARAPRSRMVLLALLLLGLMTPVAPALAQDDPLGSHGASKRFGTTGVEFWQWAFAQPAARNPLTDTTGEFCAEGQSGRTWFLAGSFVGPVVRECTIPRGKRVVFPVVNIGSFAFPDDPPAQRTEEYLRGQVAYLRDHATDLRVTVDGTPLRPALIRYEESRLFSATLPQDGVLGLPSPLSPSVDAGYYVTLRALRPGRHTIHVTGAVTAGDPGPAFSVDVTYHLTVLPTTGSPHHG
jgi:hypothetical protein